MTTSLKPFQEDVIDGISNCVIDTTHAMQAAPADRARLMSRVGAVLLEAPTGSGKTLMLANAVRRVTGSAAGRMLWLWITPFSGIVSQTRETLATEAPELRLCSLHEDRNADLRRDGDVYIFTWASVSTANANGRLARSASDTNPSLDQMLEALRARGWFIGLVVDEAHLNLGQNAAQSIAFLKDAVRPDTVLMATATPNDTSLQNFQQQLDIAQINRFTIARKSVVDARLNKSEIRAIHFHAEEQDKELLDFGEIALRFGLRSHEEIKARLKSKGIPVTPLLLVQVTSDTGAEQRAKEHLIALGMPEDKIAIHTAKEPDPAVHTIAYDDRKEVLIFKLAVATGFDAPRAWGLVSMRGSRGQGFGLQIIGRIMRIHRALQAEESADPILDTGYVFLADTDSQTGLALAAQSLDALVGEVRTVTDSVRILEVSSGGTVALTDPESGFMEALTPIPAFSNSSPPPSVPTERENTVGANASALRVGDSFTQTLFGDPIPA